MNRVLMIDDYTREKLFKDDEEIIGEIIEIYGNPYKLIGVYKATTPEQYRYGNGEGLIPRSVVGMMFGSPEIQQIQLLVESTETLSQIDVIIPSRLIEI